MMKHTIEKNLSEAIQADMPDCFQEIWERSQIMDQTSVNLNKTENKASFLQRYKKLITGTACAAALAIVFGLTAMINSRIDAIVGLDVNPSIELSVGRNDKVIKVDTLNEDAKTIVGNMNLKGSNIDVAVNAIVGSMVQNNYLGSDTGTVLVTVTGANSQKVDALKTKVTDDVKNILHENNIKGEIINQSIPADNNSNRSELEAIAKQYNISVGKAAFLQKLTASYPQFTIENLAPMNMHDIYSLILENKLDLTGIVEIDADDSGDDELLDEIEDFIEDINENTKSPGNNGTQTPGNSETQAPNSGKTNSNANQTDQNNKPGTNHTDDDDDPDDIDDNDNDIDDINDKDDAIDDNDPEDIDDDNDPDGSDDDPDDIDNSDDDPDDIDNSDDNDSDSDDDDDRSGKHNDGQKENPPVSTPSNAPTAPTEVPVNNNIDNDRDDSDDHDDHDDPDNDDDHDDDRDDDDKDD